MFEVYPQPPVHQAAWANFLNCPEFMSGTWKGSRTRSLWIIFVKTKGDHQQIKKKNYAFMVINNLYTCDYSMSLIKYIS